MQFSRFSARGFSIALAFALSACGGGGGITSAPAPVPAGGSSQSGTASVSKVIPERLNYRNITPLIELRATASAVAVKPIYFFKGRPDAGAPFAGLISVNGELYGTTEDGGANGYGAVYKISTSGIESVVHSFTYYKDGSAPRGRLVYVNGAFYGTTSTGAKGGGTVFKLSSSGSVVWSYAFGSKAHDGSAPEAGLTYVNGALFGTTALGGAVGAGTVFTVSLSGEERVVYSFGKNSLDGGEPFAQLLYVNVNGLLYGTTVGDGGGGCAGSGCGTVFSITTSGVEHVLHHFQGGNDGQRPSSALIYVNGELYGTTQGGGKYGTPFSGGGTLYQISPSGVESVLHAFGNTNDGATPVAGVVDVNNTLYGTTPAGGIGGEGGTLYDWTLSNKKEQVLYTFFGGKTGAIGIAPSSDLINLDGVLYGTCVYSPSGATNGSVFRVTL